ncbi:hypothetical protein O6H91_20G023800 [Diphasiastrum complanatum]|uniref:Uncharacterized protein n=1 Tax=Diphasiastrum complanatum TaxID=34168 RepID=A0ACC2APR3_DIPCM|nr:hypothetical protein O6H91_Y066300 [Diphasiastrum complanatum]KAJ7519122.1 hypothetical protein O6H91_20G023800 [Diphasiastrum complanatum]
MAQFIKQNEVVDSKVAHVQSHTPHFRGTCHLTVQSEVSDSSSCKKEHPDIANRLKKERELLPAAGECDYKRPPMKACYRGEKEEMDTRHPRAQSWFSPYTRISSNSEATSSSYLSTIQSQQLADENPFSLFAYPFGHMKINVNGESVRNAEAVGHHAFSHMDQLFGPESRSIYK